MVFSIISNAALWIPAITAWRYNRLLRPWFFFIESFISAFYHACDVYGMCIFSFQTLHHFDFFHAQSFIVLNAFYLIHFSYNWEWLEWILIFISLTLIAFVQAWFPGILEVQAVIAIVAVAILILYWVIWGIPRYKWDYLLIGVSFLILSVIFYIFQNVYSPWYEPIHGMWHIAASIGSHYIIKTKEPALKWQNAASKI